MRLLSKLNIVVSAIGGSAVGGFVGYSAGYRAGTAEFNQAREALRKCLVTYLNGLIPPETIELIRTMSTPGVLIWAVETLWNDIAAETVSRKTIEIARCLRAVFNPPVPI